MTGVKLYKKTLFTNAYQSTIIKSQNTAPVGPEGVDTAVSDRIGGRKMSDNKKVKGSNKGRSQGICCGITAGWMGALLSGNAAATEHSGFKEFFTTLRFQGAYYKDYTGKPGGITLLFERFGINNSNPATTSTEMTDTGVAGNLPGEESAWAGYISAYDHAVGVGYRDYRYFILEPNGGLFEYQNKAKFVADLTAHLQARRDRKDAGGDVSVKAYFYNAHG
ncbi:MAG: hypothetical protein AAF744_05175 [Pseudomonadota bacterium]